MYLRFNPSEVLTVFLLYSLGDGAESAMGEWGEWGSWSECTRSCGVGVASRSRQCYTQYSSSRRMSSNCIGLYKQFTTCNKQACPKGGLSFRAMQCAEHNDREFRGRKFQWQPYTSGRGGKCQLVCRATRYRYYAVHADKVIDGTPCDEDVPDHICVNGECKRLGCDGVIGSTATEDKCGVCNGDNSTCHIISGIFTRVQLPYGYNKVTSIPKGACNINITEMFPSRNYLVMKIRHHSKYVINGDWVLGSSGEFPAAGTLFTYHRPSTGESSSLKEYISAPGPLNTSIVIEVLKQEANQGVTYSYTITAAKKHGSRHRHHQSSTTQSSRDPTQSSKATSTVSSSNSLVGQADYAASRQEEPQRDGASDSNRRYQSYIDQLRRSSPSVRSSSAGSSSSNDYKERREAYYAQVEAERRRRERQRQREITQRQRDYENRLREREQEIQRRFDVQASSSSNRYPVNSQSQSSNRRSSSQASSGSRERGSRTSSQREALGGSDGSRSSQQNVNRGAAVDRSPPASNSQQTNKPKYSSKSRPGPNFGVQQGGPSNRPNPGPNLGPAVDQSGSKQKARPGPNFGIQQPSSPRGLQTAASARGPRPGPNFGLQPQPQGMIPPGRVQPGLVQPGVVPGFVQPGVVPPGRGVQGVVQPGIIPGVGGGQRVIIPAIQQPYPQYQQSQPYPGIAPTYNQGRSQGQNIPGYRAQQGVQGVYQVGVPAQNYNPNYGNSYYQNPGVRPVNDQISPNLPNNNQGLQVGTVNSGGEFSWAISGFTKCSRTCGGGQQETLVVCVKTDTQAIVTDENCDNNIKPKSTGIPCNNNACPPGWHTDDWSECSTSCDPGTQSRAVECKQRVSDKIQIAVSADQCVGQQRPEKARYCNEDKPCVKWRIGEWAQCSTDCGRGQRTREVVCINAADQPIPENSCRTAKPKSSEICDMGSCAKTWFFTKWSDECSHDCGSGYHIRDVFCSDTAERCRRIQRPHIHKRCHNEMPCGGKWFPGPWTKCSTTCGEGVVKRDVACVKKLAGNLLTIVGEENCLESEKPESEEPCQRPPCKPLWYMTDWTECSQSCDTGFKTREVKCLDESKESVLDCDLSQRPDTRKPCNTLPCPERTAGSRHVPSHDNRHRPAYQRPGCRDTYKQCRLVVQARLCSFSFYKDKCCLSCASHAQHHPHDS